MHNFRIIHAKRVVLGLSVISAMTFAGGCGESETASPAAVSDSKAREEMERAARLKAFDEKGLGNPTKVMGSKPKEAPKP